MLGVRTKGLVAALVQPRCLRFERTFDVDHHRERIQVKLDQLNRIFGRLQGLGNHHRYRLTRVPDPVRSERSAGRRPGSVSRGLDRERIQLGEISRHENRYHARRASGRSYIQARDPGMRVMTSQEDGVEQAHRMEVIDVAAGPAQEARVLDPADCRPKRRGRHGVSV